MALQNFSGGGSFFKPAEHSNALAILVEPISVKEGVRNEFRGDVSFRDEVSANLTIFRNSAELAGDAEPLVLAPGILTNAILASDAKAKIGQQFVATVQMGQKAYVFKSVDDATFAKVAAYVEKRDSANADAEADMFGEDAA